MKKHSTRKIKNTTLVMIFFLIVVSAIVVSLFIRLGLLIAQSRVDMVHQFVTEIKDGKGDEKFIAFNPSLHTMGVLQLSDVKQSGEIAALQIPIDAQITSSDLSRDPATLVFSTVFHCFVPTCVHMNAVDALKLYWFAKHVRSGSITIQTLALPASTSIISQAIPNVFTDDTLYKEALSIAIINASGEAGLGNELGKLLTNIGANVISITTGDTQTTTTMTTSDTQPSYTTQRLEQILHLPVSYQQSSGISDIIITIGEKHPQL